MSFSIHDPEISLADIMRIWPRTVDVFLRYRMLCVGCVIARFHTVADASREHGIDEFELRAALAAAAGEEGPGPGSGIRTAPNRSGPADEDR